MLFLSKCLPYIAIIPSILSVCFSFVLYLIRRALLQVWKVWTVLFSKLSDRIVWIRKCERTAVAHMSSMFLKQRGQDLRDVFTYIAVSQSWSGEAIVALALSAQIITYSSRDVLKCRICRIPAAFQSIISLCFSFLLPLSYWGKRSVMHFVMDSNLLALLPLFTTLITTLCVCVSLCMCCISMCTHTLCI